MKIVDLLQSDKVCISCELFPPKAGSELKNALHVVEEIAQLKPHFMSVTYGAGGTSIGETLSIARAIQESGRPALAHLTCINARSKEIQTVLKQLQMEKVQNILALRGDAIAESSYGSDFSHASDLMKKIKTAGDFCVGGACYPEGHPESDSLDQDILHTLQKVDSGCDFLVSQMIFDNNVLYNYMYRLLRNGIDIPVVAGIMPVTNVNQIKRICELSGTKLPANYRAIVEKFANNPEALKQAGIAYATGQIVDLIANGLKNIHVYTMNRPEIIRGIMRNLPEIIK